MPHQRRRARTQAAVGAITGPAALRDRAEEFGARNGVPGELLVRLVPTKVLVQLDVTG